MALKYQWVERKLCANYLKVSGVRDDYRRYEQAIIKGKIPCPYKIEFRDAEGNLITNHPIPLTPDGKPKTYF